MTLRIRIERRPWLLVAASLVVVAVWLAIATYIHFDRLVEAKLRTGPFSNAADIYAASKTIRPGDERTPADMAACLDRAGYSASSNAPSGSYRRGGDTLEIHPGPGSYAQQHAARVHFEGAGIARLEDLDTGATLDSYRLDPELITNLAGQERERRRIVKFSDIPKVLVDAVVSVEDKRFFEHSGLDPLRLIKAAYVDLREGRKEQGGSTITMQLARGLWLEPEKNWQRKASEFLITTILERRLSKQQIFEFYANQAYLGRQDTFSIHGFGEAARVFFNCDISRLTLPQAALLAGLIQRPSYSNPFRYPDRAIARRNTVLGLMSANGYISAGESARAAEAPLDLSPSKPADSEWSYFLALANDELQARVPDNSQPASYRVYTTLDADMQNAAVEAIRIGMAKVDAQLKGRESAKGASPQAALVALDPDTGEVKAAVGGRDYAGSQLNHVLSMRQPGSVFKAFVYAAALDSHRFTEASTVDDVPTTINFMGELYQPTNFEKTFHGPVTLRFALARSLNVATVNLGQKLGYAKIVEMARAAGLNSGIRATPSVALGSYETTPLEIAGAYTVFANEGNFAKPTFLHEVRQANGKVVTAGSTDRHRALDPKVAFLMRELLQEVIRSGTAAGVWGMGLQVPAAGKTGTSHDGWFAGFTPGLLCVVWVGFDDNRELGLEGARSALPIWAEFMKRAVKERRNFANPPPGITSARVDPETGQLAGEYCPTNQLEFFLAGSEPAQTCTLHITPTFDLFVHRPVLPPAPAPPPE